MNGIDNNKEQHRDRNREIVSERELNWKWNANVIISYTENQLNPIHNFREWMKETRALCVCWKNDVCLKKKRVCFSVLVMANAAASEFFSFRFGFVCYILHPLNRFFLILVFRLLGYSPCSFGFLNSFSLSLQGKKE